MRDILESTNSGVILPRALIQASTQDYGPISHEIAVAMTKFSMGYDFKSSIMDACERLKHPFMLQVGQIIIEAYAAGGKMHDVLQSSVVLFNGMEQYDEQKQSELRPYTQTRVHFRGDIPNHRVHNNLAVHRSVEQSPNFKERDRATRNRRLVLGRIDEDTAGLL